MKGKLFILLFFGFFHGNAHAHHKNDSASINAARSNVMRINLIISSRVKKIDPAPLSFQVQAWFMRIFHKEKLFVVIADSAKDMIVLSTHPQLWDEKPNGSR